MDTAADRPQPRLLHGSVLAMIGSAACWGMGIVMSKAALAHLPPVPLLAVQLAASVGMLWLLTGTLRLTFKRSQVWHGLPGIFEPGLAYLIGIAGVGITSASNATLIAALEPFVILIIAWLVLRERLARRTLGLLGLALLGVLLVTQSEASGGSASLAGDLLVFGGTAAAAVYVLLSRRSVQSLDPLPLAAIQQTWGLLLVLAVLPFAGGADAVAGSVWVFAALTGVVQYALAFTLYLMALRHLPATQAALYLTLIPVFGLAGAALLLGEVLTAAQWAGGALIIAALLGLNLLAPRGNDQRGAG